MVAEEPADEAAAMSPWTVGSQEELHVVVLMSASPSAADEEGPSRGQQHFWFEVRSNGGHGGGDYDDGRRWVKTIVGRRSAVGIWAGSIAARLNGGGRMLQNAIGLCCFFCRKDAELLRVTMEEEEEK
jgi:hypothetical protein